MEADLVQRLRGMSETPHCLDSLKQCLNGSCHTRPQRSPSNNYLVRVEALLEVNVQTEAPYVHLVLLVRCGSLAITNHLQHCPDH